MIIEKFLSMLIPQQVESLLIERGFVQPKTVASVDNKGNGIYGFCIYESADVVKRFIIKIEPLRIRLMGSYTWRGSMA